MTAAKALLNLENGDVPSFDAVENKRELLANGYLCKGIQLIKAENKTWSWVDVRKRLGLEEYTCRTSV